ncbi:MAG TPA: ABC transporter ATP-binding protein [Pseudogracilibacillus sp.]|nr:ABC transporter ATP-binding protein [Pseudogracilibacillus sp.]
MLTVKNLSKQFKDHLVIDGVSFTLKKGACTALIGPNGAGKTTILRMLTGLIKASEGSITYTNNTGDFRHLIGYLPQYPKFDDWMTGEEFLTYCCKLYGLSSEETEGRTRSLLEQVGLSDAKQKRISTYSGGMKQRLGIAQALVHQPSILFLDEPVSSLDPIGRRDVLTLMEELKENMTILFSTHILNDADEISDSVIVLKAGKVVEDGTMENLQRKYTTSKITLQFERNNNDIVNQIEQLSKVTSIESIGQYIHVYVSDLHSARKEILEFTLKNNLRLTEFRIGRVSMEELFVKAVN